MEITLFMDDLDRDVFVDERVLNAGWKTIYKDSAANVIKGTGQKIPSFHFGFEWNSKVFLREEDFGGLLFEASTNKIFKVDKEAHLMLSMLWEDKKVAEVNEQYENLVSQLLDHNLIKLSV